MSMSRNNQGPLDGDFSAIAEKRINIYKDETRVFCLACDSNLGIIIIFLEHAITVIWVERYDNCVHEYPLTS